jgi:leader peptidase (prepilin peptidase)/N-methyltransferase
VTGDLAAQPPLPLLAGAGFILGAIIGSYLATILVRWPQGRSAVSGRSHCDACGRALGALELVPILSFAAARGRCRRCGARIDARHMLVEAAGGLVGLVAMIAHPLPMAGATLVFGLMLLVIAALDAEHQWLPDALTLPLIPLGLLAALAGWGPPLLDRAIGAVAGGALLWAIGWLYARLRGREGLGGGDPKLLAGIGAWVGVLHLPLVLLGAGLAGLVMAGVMRLRGRAVEATTRLPLGTLLALAAWPIWLSYEAIYSASVYALSL